MALILIVEDEHVIATTLEKYLQQAGFDTHIIDHGLEVVDWVKTYQPDLILLDWMLPGKDGLSICEEVCEFSDTSIIMTTAKVDEIDRLIGLETGADDYICKPYSPREVVARVKACLRRLKKLDTAKEQLTLDTQYLTVAYNGESTVLTPLEFELIKLFYNNPNRIFSRQTIIDCIYKDYRNVSEKTVNSHIRNLRKKLADISSCHEWIHSIYAIGYRYDPPASESEELH